VRWDVATGARRETRASGQVVGSSRDASIFVLPAPRGEGVVVRDATTGALLGSVRPPRGSSMGLLPDGRHLHAWLSKPTPGYDHRFPEKNFTLSVFDVRTGRRLWSRGPIYDVADVYVSADWRTLIVFDQVVNYDDRGPVQAWDAATGKTLSTIPVQAVQRWAASGDGAMLSTSSSDERGIALWDVATGRLRGKLDEDSPSGGSFVLDETGRLAANFDPPALRIYTTNPPRRIREVSLSAATILWRGDPRFVYGGRAVAFGDENGAWLARVSDGAPLRVEVIEILSPGGARSCAAVVSTPDGLFDADEDAIGFVKITARRGGTVITLPRGPETDARRRRDLLADFLSAPVP
jgi:hypothetical protein